MITFVLGNLTVIGLGLGFLSAVLLSVGISPLLRSLRFVAECHALSIETMMRRGDVIQFTGIEQNLEKAARKANRRLRLGFVMLAASFVCQGASLYLQPVATPHPAGPPPIVP